MPAAKQCTGMYADARGGGAHACSTISCPTAECRRTAQSETVRLHALQAVDPLYRQLAGYKVLIRVAASIVDTPVPHSCLPSSVLGVPLGAGVAGATGALVAGAVTGVTGALSARSVTGVTGALVAGAVTGAVMGATGALLTGAATGATGALAMGTATGAVVGTVMASVVLGVLGTLGTLGALGLIGALGALGALGVLGALGAFGVLLAGMFLMEGWESPSWFAAL